MEKLFQEYMDRLDELHGEIEPVVQGLPVQALDWSPGPEMNSLAVLIVHLTGAERYWVGDVAAREPSGRDREAEFRVTRWDAAALEKRLRESAAYVRGVLSRLTLQDLEQLRGGDEQDRQVTVAWALLHALEHTALHVGQIQMVGQLWNQQRR